MNKGYISDHANRDWCTKPASRAWRDAFAKAFKAMNPNPKVAISSSHPRVAVMFYRGMK